MILILIIYAFGLLHFGKNQIDLKGNTILLLINSDTRDVSCLNSGLIMLDEHKM